MRLTQHALRGLPLDRPLGIAAESIGGEPVDQFHLLGELGCDHLKVTARADVIAPGGTPRLPRSFGTPRQCRPG